MKKINKIKLVIAIATMIGCGENGNFPLGLNQSAVGIPGITSVTPNSGPTVGGTNVMIAGYGFGSDPTYFYGVTFGGTTASYTWVSSTSITATAPAYTAGVVDVVVNSNGGFSEPTLTDQYTYGNAAPVANFTGTPVSGVAPLNVIFTDTSTNTPTSWSWDFGDTYTSTSQNPMHLYSASGIYTVSLTATNDEGSNTFTRTNYITVNVPAPVANFYGNPTYGPAPLYVSFTDTSTNAPTSWNWDFGDAYFSTDQNPQHTYSANGIYTVSLTVTNAGGGNTFTRQSYITVNVPVPPPTISIITPSTGTTAGGTAVTITGTNFTGINTVTFGGMGAMFSFYNDNMILAYPPSHSAGIVDVSIITPGGTVNAVNGYTYADSLTVISSVPGGHGSISCQSPVSWGGYSSYCSITPDMGYSLTALTDNGNNVMGSVVGNSYTVNNVQENHVIIGAFARGTFVISAAVLGSHGAMTCQSPVQGGDSSTCTITPDLGYAVQTLTDNNYNVVAAINNNTYVISSVMENHAVQVSFNKALGTQCSEGSECLKGHCVDGLCCNTSCTDQCAACDISGSEGTCTPVVGGAPHGSRTPCDTDNSACGGICDGTRTTKCVYPDQTTSCREPTCTDNVATLAATCDGQGACEAKEQEPCGNYICGTNACKTSCAVDADCNEGSLICVNNQCVQGSFAGGGCSMSTGGKNNCYFAAIVAFMFLGLGLRRSLRRKKI